MDDQLSRKRGALLDCDKCFICQEKKGQKLLTPNSDGLKTIESARQIRQKLRSDNFRDATDRLTEVFTACPPLQILCHNGCRASYTSSAKLQRLKAADSATPESNASTSTSTPTDHPQNILLRSKLSKINWNLCIFCQKETKEKIHLIQELQVSKRILQASQYDQILRTRLACVNDLTAADGKHHSSCHVKFTRKIAKIIKSPANRTDMSLLWLSQELEHLASHADILDLTDVWERYCAIANEANITIPPSYISRRSTFKEKLAERIHGVYEVVVLHDQARTDPRTLLVPTKYQYIPFSAMAKEDDSELTIPTFKHEQNDSFLSMVHVALRIRGDILSHPRPEGIDISENRAIDCVPDSLYMFLNLILGGQKLLEEEVESNHDNKHNCQSRILSIAQDVVYTASGDKYLTPKHIGMGSTLHQATRSKELVNLFHKAGPRPRRPQT